MVNTNLKLAGAGLGLLVLGIALGRYTLPARVETKTVTQTVVQTVTKTVEVDKSEEHRDKELQETIVKKPDGTVITTKTWIDKTVVSREDDKGNDSTTNSSTNTTTDTVTVYDTNQYSLQLMIGKNFGNADSFIPGSEFVYGAQLNKKFIGPVSMGVFGLTDKTFGVSVGLVF